MIQVIRKIQPNNDNTYIVYCHINKINGKKYVGQTMRTPKQRFGKDGNNYCKCPYFYNAIKKYGWNNFEHKVLIDNLTKEEADELEKIYIEIYQTQNSNFGYNLKSGGNAGGKQSEETKKKISESEKGRKLTEEHKKHISNSKMGYKQSEETKKKISEAHKGKKKNYHPHNFGIPLSQEQKNNLSKSFKGRVYINKEGIVKFIKPNELEKYLNDGWNRGKK